ncbi:MAG: hypothetical protein A2277_13905 [Desulfobacterales bacterium RIFOXYA12_FULL_46_15]|nr:MAG: hypothetical protein A2277_13905 [Desulfobacterales bacterium RIFOXYA12_FULL_46_15]
MTQDYDLIIHNGTVVDGSGRPSVQADVAVSRGLIAQIGDLSRSSSVTRIDAAGLVVAPGFIDLHSHTDLFLPALPTADSLVCQGITTVVTGQCGLSPAPLGTGNCRRTRELFGARLNRIGEIMPWPLCSHLGKYLDFLTQICLSVNVVPLVGQGVIRGAVMGGNPGSPDDSQRALMRHLAEEAMDEGAFGISTGLIYPPGSWSTTQELVDIVSCVAARGGMYFSHIRNEGEKLLESIREALEIGRLSGARVHISHFKAAGKCNCDKSVRALELLDKAAETQPLGMDMYPYTAGSTSLVSLLPDWALQGNRSDLFMRLKDPKQRRKMTSDMATGGLAQGNWEGVLIIQSESRPEYAGYRLSDLAAQSGLTPEEWLYDALLATHCDPMMVLFMMSEDNRRNEICHPLMAIGTDGFGLATAGLTSGIMTHPRSFGTFPRILGRYCREEKLISLETAVYKMTGLAASYLNLKDRGIIREASVADLTIFNPKTVIDTATYDCPKSYPKGIDTVLVAGQVVVSQGEHTGARPGKVIRRNG